MPKKNRKTFFAVDPDNQLFVRLEAVMHPLCALCDGLPLTFFGRGKTAYLKIDDAIAWCREEMKSHSREKYETMISGMERAKAEVANGTAEINEGPAR